MKWRVGDLAIIDHQHCIARYRGRTVEIVELDVLLTANGRAVRDIFFPGSRAHAVCDVVTGEEHAVPEPALHPITDPDQHQTRETTKEIPA